MCLLLGRLWCDLSGFPLFTCKPSVAHRCVPFCLLTVIGKKELLMESCLFKTKVLIGIPTCVCVIMGVHAYECVLVGGQGTLGE